MSDIGTTSIVFDDTRLCTDFSFNDDPNIDPTDSPFLIDPNSVRDSLQQLRVLKTRNTGSVAQLPITLGRTRSKVLNFNEFTYEQFKMRRKIEVLNQKNKSNETKKQTYSRFSGGSKTRYMSYSTKQRLKQLRNMNSCQDLPFISHNAPFSNGGGTLYYDPQIPFNSSL